MIRAFDSASRITIRLRDVRGLEESQNDSMIFVFATDRLKNRWIFD